MIARWAGSRGPAVPAALGLVLVWAAGSPAAPPGEVCRPDLAAETRAQHDELTRQFAERARQEQIAGQAFCGEAVLRPSDRDGADVVLRRTEALLADLSAGAPDRDWSGARGRLAALRSRCASVAAADADGRYGLYAETCALRREIAFANPLLNFDKLLFIKRRRAAGEFHMCDQYYGFNARPGGGLYVLVDPFGPAPKLVDLLAAQRVTKGRLAGQTLDGGAVLSPELSYDGRTVWFAYSQCQGGSLEWSPRASYHIFRVATDLAGPRRLVQVTDGPWDDFDPCPLPGHDPSGGRIVFISERRGGYLRCGRHCPTYTMFTMRPDGNDIRPLSHHETHEWHPSVDRDGRIVYTRWDYVDRDTNVAHHIWTCYPDGRDPRSPHGNYPARREGRPWMEMSIRAIPGSHRYVATAAAHHGNAFGSLVLIDLAGEDDNAMSQLRRLTPDAPFPEAERKWRPIRDAMVYATAWPLSESYYLCAYDPRAGNHGLYLIDRFGNRELIHRDASIPCLSPMPLRERPMPPVLADQTAPGAAPGAEAPGQAAGPHTVAVMNVYDSDFAWPAGTRITALRIVQVLPKSTPPPNQPRIGAADQTNARAVLGTVPVEADGSAHFEAPAGKVLYFQALDERQLAVQSMRSGTYVRPGQRLLCQGCHEPQRRAPRAAAVPLALRRAPSKITPDADGSNPFSYVRLVQPVLDRHCTDCHRRKNALDLSGSPGGKHGWTRSYANLAGKYGFYYHVSNGSIGSGVHGGVRTVAGGFGAKAARLLDYLDQRHHGVKLPPEDFHRLTLWLDCNSEFYGAYENTPAQARGEVVQPSLE